MAEYSKEWCDLKDIGILPDFSVNEIFISLEQGETIMAICEGFGFTKILNKNGHCYVILNGKELAFDELNKLG